MPAGTVVHVGGRGDGALGYLWGSVAFSLQQ
jgi:hypothetical protein